MTSARSVSTLAIVGLTALAAIGVVAYGYAEFGGWNAEGAGAAARYTARFSFPIFVLAWSASALATLWPGGWRGVMLRRRRAIGLSFAAAHGVHFAALLVAVLVFAAQPSAKTVYGGGFGYVMVALMALTSNDWSLRKLGPRNWKALHTFGGLVIAVIFATSYVGRLEEKAWLAVPALSLLGAALVLKLAAGMKKRAPRAA
jgi:methionine sulfoxide reductase heme-binding subunit